jgi:hypothetical protein
VPPGIPTRVIHSGEAIGNSDVSQNRIVATGDPDLVNAVLTQPVTAANFLKDVNASGTLTVADKGIANASVGKTLPSP